MGSAGVRRLVAAAMAVLSGPINRTDWPTQHCLFQVQDAKSFKSFSLSNHAGLLHAWNAADPDEVTGTFKPSDTYGLKGEPFAVYDFFDKKVQVATAAEEMPLALPRVVCKLFIVVPL